MIWKKTKLPRAKFLKMGEFSKLSTRKILDTGLTKKVKTKSILKNKIKLKKYQPKIFDKAKITTIKRIRKKMMEGEITK